MTVALPSIVEIYLCDPAGVRIECLDYVTEYEYGLIANSPGPFRIRLPSKFDRKKIRLDNIVEIWRGYGPGTLKMDYCGFVRAWRFADEAGLEYTELYGLSTMDLLRRRIMRDYSDDHGDGILDYADDMTKSMVYDTLGAGAAGERNLTSVGGGFTIQKDLSDGPAITGFFRNKNLYEICSEIASTAEQAGHPIYFDIVPLVSSLVVGALAFQYQTFTEQRGDDRTWDSFKPIFIGPDWGNFQNGSLDSDYMDEVNYATVLGKGLGDTQEEEEVIALTTRDLVRAEMSIWNRREGAVDARQIEVGDTASMVTAGEIYLDENKPRFSFTGEIIETPAFRYGRDWGFGDRVTAVYAGMQKDAMIKAVVVGRDSSGQETITAELEFEE